MAARKSTRKFQAEVSRLLHLVVNSLYSHPEIFLRELVSNASDAIDKVRVLSLQDAELLGDDPEFRIRVWADDEARTITIEDNGVGMSRDELVENLGTVAHSGTLKFLETMKEQGDTNLIGQFGVGFYSAFLVADEVTVTTRKAGEDEAWTWRSDAKESYTIESAERAGRGTTLVLHVKDEQGEFLDGWKLRSLVKQYSDFVQHPIFVGRKPYGDDEEGLEDGLKFEQANSGKALWQRDPESIEESEYTEFYKSVANDWEDPLVHTHFTVEGRQLFTGLLYVPKRAPFDLFHRDHQRGVRLFVKRVFILDKAEDLVPVWLRFVKGVIDSDDLPLNVSRELLQDSGVTRTIKKQVVKKTLDRLGTLLADDREAYETFWNTFGAVLKEGLAMEHGEKDLKRIGKLCLFRSSTQEGLTTLSEYVERKPEDQEAIYYVYGESEAAVAGSPHLEALKTKGYEVLFMTDAIDQWAVDGLKEWDDLKFVSAADADLDLDEDEDAKKAREEKAEQMGGFFDRVKEVLEAHVSEVRLSKRLTDSPACLVVPEGGQSAYLERLMKSHDPNAPSTKRILELNGDHPLIQSLQGLSDKGENERLGEWIEVLYDQALLTEGSPVVDPNRLARRMTSLLQQAASSQLS